jgi:hypothetical protein
VRARSCSRWSGSRIPTTALVIPVELRANWIAH